MRSLLFEGSFLQFLLTWPAYDCLRRLLPALLMKHGQFEIFMFLLNLRIVMR